MELPDGFAMVPFGPREDARDAFVSLRHTTLASLPAGAVVGTSSLRRECQLRRAYPSLVIKPLRGNVNTRLAKLEAGDYDAIILAAAGLKRLGFGDAIRELLPLELGAARHRPGRARDRVPRGARRRRGAPRAFRGSGDAAAAPAAERALGLVVEGSCEVPLGGHATVMGAAIVLEGFLGMPDGTTLVRERAEGATADAARLGPGARRAHPGPGRARRAGPPRPAPEMTAGPLAGLGVVLTRPRAQCENIAAALESRGARVVIFPALDIVPVELSAASREALASLPAASLAIFVSANAAEHGVAAARRAGPWPATRRASPASARPPRHACAPRASSA